MSKEEAPSPPKRRLIKLTAGVMEEYLNKDNADATRRTWLRTRFCRRMQTWGDLTLPRLLDEKCQASITDPNMLITWYLMASYAYYQKDANFISDYLFDRICRLIDQKWDMITHRHKRLVNREDMSAGTCLLSEHLYPSIVVDSAYKLLCGEDP